MNIYIFIKKFLILSFFLIFLLIPISARAQIETGVISAPPVSISEVPIETGVPLETPMEIEAISAPPVSISEVPSEIKTVYIFTSPTCPHCLAANKFLESLSNEYGLDVLIQDYNVAENIERLTSFYQKYEVPSGKQGLVPAIFIGERYFIGFNEQIKEEILAYLLNQEAVEKGRFIHLPIIGQINLLDFSLPILAIIMGAVDGFNVCSLGALIIILGLVTVFRSRQKIIFLGGAFILTTALIYGLLIFLWYKFFSLVAPYIRSFEIFIGLFAIGGGIYLLREFYRAYKNGPICRTNNLMTRLIPKIERIFQNKTNYLVLAGAVISFAAVVTIVEFPCSAIIPVLFTSILVEAGLPLATSLSYIGLFMLFYLLDEAIIFLIAVYTLKIKIVSPKFIIFFNLLAALIFIFLGTVYLFGWLA